MSRKQEIVEELVNTRINGNSIAKNKTYVGMMSRVKKSDINEYADSYGMEDLFGTKLEMIDQIVKRITGGGRLRC